MVTDEAGKCTYDPNHNGNIDLQQMRCTSAAGEVVNIET